MAKSRNVLTSHEYYIIVAHNERLMEACQRAIEGYEVVEPKRRPLWVEMQLRYWRNVKSGLKWSSQIAKQSTPSLKDKPDGGPVSDSKAIDGGGGEASGDSDKAGEAT